MTAAHALHPHSFQPCRAACVGQVSTVHMPVVGNILQAQTIGAERILEAFRHSRARLVEIVFRQRVQKRQGRLTHLTTGGKNVVEGRKLTDVSTHLHAVEAFLPLR